MSSFVIIVRVMKDVILGVSGMFSMICVCGFGEGLLMCIIWGLELLIGNWGWFLGLLLRG